MKIAVSPSTMRPRKRRNSPLFEQFYAWAREHWPDAGDGFETEET